MLTNWLGSCQLNKFNSWRNGQCDSNGIKLVKDTWLKKMLFHPSSQAVRYTASSLFLLLMKDHERKKLFINILISYLAEVSILCLREHNLWLLKYS